MALWSGLREKEMEAQVRRYSEVHGPSVVVSWIIGESHFKHEFEARIKAD